MRDLSKYELVDGEGCAGCVLDNYQEYCFSFFEWLTGESCDKKILKKKEVWETCTKENTKVGDKVKNKRDEIYLIVAISNISEDVLVKDLTPGMEEYNPFQSRLSILKIKVS